LAVFKKNISIKYRLVGWMAALVLLSSAVASVVIYSTVRETMEDSIIAELSSATDAIGSMVQTSAKVSVRNRLRAIAEKNVDILNGFEEDVLAGKMTRKEAMELCKQILLSQKVGKTGYIYCIKPDATVVVHPVKSMVGQNISSEWLAKQQAQLKSGYLEYEWANPGELFKRDKALYMEYFAPWDWIVSVSTYRDEFNSLVDIKDFRTSVADHVVGETGYVFILSGNGDVVLHPTLSGRVVDSMDDEDAQVLFRQMLEQREGQITYSWKEAGQVTAREKLMFFRYIPEVDWFVASASYLDEVYAPLDRLRYLLIAMGAMTIILILPMVYYLGSRFTRPIVSLSNSIAEADKGDLSVRAMINSHGEVAELATRFNEYMGQLEEYRDELETEIDERRKVEQQLRLFAMVFENALEGISITDKNGDIVAVNPAFSTITGYDESEVIGKNPRVLKSDRHEVPFYQDMWQKLLADGAWHGEIWNRRKNGESYPEILSISSVKDAAGSVVNHVAVFHDISDMKLKDEQIEHQAYHDALTGLPNRVLAQDRLSVAIAHAKREGARVVILSLDVDNFKKINDSLGHSLGDELIQKVAARLKDHCLEADTVARLGGDEFLILLEHVEDEREAVDLAERVLRAFDAPFYVGERELQVTASIGVTMYPDDGKEAGILMGNADMAMYQSKARGKNSYFLFTQEVNARISRRLEMENDMRRALKEKEFTVYFQPKIEVASEQVVGMEALVRWNQGDGTVVSPADFIPLAEETGLIVPLGEFVLEAACRAMQVLDGVGCSNISVAVNLSPIQFEQGDLVEMVLSNLQRNGLDPSKLELEITESTLMTDVEASVAKLNRLVEYGISIAIDDFGTGHSSLYYLKNLPINVLKIDRSFIRDITADDSDAQIVKTIVLMAHSLGISTVAEGVEEEEQLELLKSFNCELIQGYYYSRPLPLEEVIAYLQERAVICKL
jgi:diguanylate cyclase (GGDEF)-like protein/PAS domain S-box-containing protein